MTERDVVIIILFFIIGAIIGLPIGLGFILLLNVIKDQIRWRRINKFCEATERKSEALEEVYRKGKVVKSQAELIQRLLIKQNNGENLTPKDKKQLNGYNQFCEEYY